MACRLTRSFVNSLTGKILSTLLELFIAWLSGGRALLAAVLAPPDARASSERSSFRINELTSSRVNRDRSQSDETGHSELSWSPLSRHIHLAGLFAQRKSPDYKKTAGPCPPTRAGIRKESRPGYACDLRRAFSGRLSAVGGRRNARLADRLPVRLAVGAEDGRELLDLLDVAGPALRHVEVRPHHGSFSPRTMVLANKIAPLVYGGLIWINMGTLTNGPKIGGRSGVSRA